MATRSHHRYPWHPTAIVSISIRSIVVMMMKHPSPSLLSQSTTATVVDPGKDYELAFADLVTTYGMTSAAPDLAAMVPTESVGKLANRRRHSIFASFRSQAAPHPPTDTVREVDEGAEGDEGDAPVKQSEENSKTAKKERRWSLKPKELFGLVK